MNQLVVVKKTHPHVDRLRVNHNFTTSFWLLCRLYIKLVCIIKVQGLFKGHITYVMVKVLIITSNVKES